MMGFGYRPVRQAVPGTLAFEGRPWLWIDKCW
jgi:hypothetical protein